MSLRKRVSSLEKERVTERLDRLEGLFVNLGLLEVRDNRCFVPPVHEVHLPSVTPWSKRFAGDISDLLRDLANAGHELRRLERYKLGPEDLESLKADVEFLLMKIDEYEQLADEGV